MFEPDVALTDFALAAQNAVLAGLLFPRAAGRGRIERAFAALFAALGAAGLFGGLWHGFLREGTSASGPWVWLATMMALATAAAALWSISAALLPPGPRRAGVVGLAGCQFLGQTLVSAFVTDAFWVGAVGMLPPTSLLAALYIRAYRATRRPRLLIGLSGLALAVAAGLVIVYDISLHPRWITPNALYHLLQLVACLLVFHSVPGLRAYPR